MAANIIFDIETLALPDEVILKNAPEWSEEEALTRKGNRTKPETISAFLEEDRENYRKNLLDKAALNPETATIAIAGFYRDGRVDQIVVDEKLTEHLLLCMTMRWLSESRGSVLGWNLKGFDLPFLIKRCWISGARVPTEIYAPLQRYAIPDRFVDMMDTWKAGGWKSSYTSLNNALKAVGMPGKPDGSEFAKLWREDKQKALKYQEEELLAQSQLYRRMGVDV